METIEKLNAIIAVVNELTDEDAANLLAARDRITETERTLDEKDNAGITRIDSILAIYSTLPKEETPEEVPGE